MIAQSRNDREKDGHSDENNGQYVHKSTGKKVKDNNYPHNYHRADLQSSYIIAKKSR